MDTHEEILKIARNLIKKDPSLTDWVVNKFPELKESEDEKILRVLKEGFDTLCKDDEWYGGITNLQILIWLEKQGKQNTAWSEEDENRFSNLILLVKCSKENEATKKGFINFINKLKSLRPRLLQNMSLTDLNPLNK